MLDLFDTSVNRREKLANYVAPELSARYYILCRNFSHKLFSFRS